MFGNKLPISGGDPDYALQALGRAHSHLDFADRPIPTPETLNLQPQPLKWGAQTCAQPTQMSEIEQSLYQNQFLHPKPYTRNLQPQTLRQSASDVRTANFGVGDRLITLSKSIPLSKTQPLINSSIKLLTPDHQTRVPRTCAQPTRCWKCTTLPATRSNKPSIKIANLYNLIPNP